MKKLLLIASILTLFIQCENTGQQAPASTSKIISPAEDRSIEPGIRVGQMTANTTQADLINIYGAAHVAKDSLSVGENLYIPSTKLFPNMPDELRIAWQPEAMFQKIARIIIEHPNSRWKTAHGITVGTSLQDIVDFNQTNFNIFGLDQPYPANIVSWEGGELDGKGIGILFGFDKATFEQLPPAEKASISGEEIYTDEAALQKLDLKVKQLFLYF